MKNLYTALSIQWLHLHVHQ